MEITFNAVITENKMTLQLNHNQGTIEIFDTNDQKTVKKKDSIYFLLKDTTLLAIENSDFHDHHDRLNFNKIIAITVPWDIEKNYLIQAFITDTRIKKLTLVPSVNETCAVPTSSKKVISEYKEKILVLLEHIGYSFQAKEELSQPKTKPAKARHLWSKEVSQIEFFINTRESKATVLWQKRNEMLLKAGATMMATPPLNKGGSLGFSAKMGQRIREDYHDKINNFVTTEDIILKSVNEIGLFLYFGGTNSWLEMVDATGKTINEWTIVH